MKRIKIKDNGFQTTHFGYLEPNTEYDLPDHFADYCVDRMKSAVRVEQKKQRGKKK